MRLQVSQQALYRESRKCDTGSPRRLRSLHATGSPPPTSRRPAGALHARLRPGPAKLRAAPGRRARPAQNPVAPPPRHLGPRGAFGSAAGPAGTGYGPIDASPRERQSWSRTRRSPPPRRRPPPSTPCALADAPAPLGPRERALLCPAALVGGGMLGGIRCVVCSVVSGVWYQVKRVNNSIDTLNSCSLSLLMCDSHSELLNAQAN
jgi:hypothetical protein